MQYPSQGRIRDHGERLEEAHCSNRPPRVTRTHMLFPKQTFLECLVHLPGPMLVVKMEVGRALRTRGQGHSNSRGQPPQRTSLGPAEKTPDSLPSRVKVIAKAAKSCFGSRGELKQLDL